MVAIGTSGPTDTVNADGTVDLGKGLCLRRQARVTASEPP
jgi:hypothetical protein